MKKSPSPLPNEFWVKVTPRSSRNIVVGWKEGRLSVRVCAAPADGKANQALMEILSDYSGLPKSSFTLVRGGSSRIKLIRTMP